jgi:hypothetical protein
METRQPKPYNNIPGNPSPTNNKPPIPHKQQTKQFLTFWLKMRISTNYSKMHGNNNKPPIPNKQPQTTTNHPYPTNNPKQQFLTFWLKMRIILKCMAGGRLRPSGATHGYILTPVTWKRAFFSFTLHPYTTNQKTDSVRIATVAGGST